MNDAALFGFHARVGVRLALRAMTPFAGVLFAVVGLFDEPADFLAGMAAGLASPSAGPSGAVVLAAILFATAAWAAPRLTHGLSGWIRHLPASGISHRRAAAGALVLVQAPVLLVAIVLTLGSLFHGDAISIPRIAGIPLLAVAAAITALPVGRPLAAAPIGVGMAALAVAGRWEALPVAAALLVLWDRTAGPLVPVRRERRFRLLARAPLSALIAWRAIGPRIVGAFIVPAFVLALAGFFLANNVLSAESAEGGVRFGGILAVAALMSFLSAELGTRRPVWPWSRSLPWSARQRVVADALFLAVHALPLVAASATLHPRAALAVLGAVPALALRAAGALAWAQEMRIGARGVVLAEGFVIAGVVALAPWTTLALLAVTPLILGGAARRDRDRRVGRFIPLHHDAAGDPLSWSAE